jgi:hypothetical protein
MIDHHDGHVASFGQTHNILEVVDTGERLVVIASHWPSRRLGRLATEPVRIAVAENLAFLSTTFASTRSPTSGCGRLADLELRPA